MTRLNIFLKIIIPDTLPYISLGIKQAISYSLIATVITEMFMSAEFGLGKRIVDYHLTYETGKMYSVIILLGLIGYLTNYAYQIFEEKKLKWMKNC